MSIKIKFDASGNPIQPTIVLGYKSGRLIGKLPATSVHLKDELNASSDIQFIVFKNDCAETLWKKIKDFKLVWCKEWNKWFEITVDLDDGEGIKKTVSCTSLGEAELSQINVPNLSINSEDDLKLNDYTPTVFYNPSDTKHSLLNRIMERAPHYSIGYVSNSLRNIQKNYSFDGSIHDAMMEIAEQTVALFRFDCYTDANGALKREVNVYDLESYCVDCGNRGEFTDACDKCGSTNIIPPDYGEDTTIFISTDNLANSVTFSTDTGSVKNCFRLEAGDDLMTATIKNCNPDGSSYLWYFNDDMKADMSDALRAKLAEYQDNYDYYQEDYSLRIQHAPEIAMVEGTVDSYTSHTVNGVQYASRIVIDGTGYEVREKGVAVSEIAEYVGENIYAATSNNIIMNAIFWKTDDVTIYDGDSITVRTRKIMAQQSLNLRRTLQRAKLLMNWIIETIGNGGFQRMIYNYLVGGLGNSELRFLIGSSLIGLDLDAYFNSDGFERYLRTLVYNLALAGSGHYDFDGYADMIQRGIVTQKDITLFPDELNGYADLIKEYYNVIDFYLYLHDEMLPVTTAETKTAATELQKVTQSLHSVSVEKLSGCSETTATNSVQSMIKAIVDTAKYKISITDVSYTTGGELWSANIKLSSYSDETDTAQTAPNSPLILIINEDYENFIRQKMDKILGKSETETTGIKALLALPHTLVDSQFAAELHKYNLSSLNAIRDVCQNCLDILISEGAGDKDAWKDRYEAGYLVEETDGQNTTYTFWRNTITVDGNETYANPISPREGKTYYNYLDENYYKYESGSYTLTNGNITGNVYEDVYRGYERRLAAIKDEISYRENELAFIESMQAFIEKKMNDIQSELNLEENLGTALWNELSAFRREDVYQNNNYISDGLNTKELVENAEAFIDAARKEIYKSSTMQHSISTNLNNLLFMREFQPIVNHFEVGNWLRTKADDTVYKLRLVGYEIDFENPETIAVSFSDVKTTETGKIYDLESVIATSQSMATAFGYVARQADKGDKTNQKVDNWVSNGLDMTDVKIVSDNDNQNITFDNHGILCREYDPETDSYSGKQMKIINKGLYLTDDNWRTSRAAVGNFTFYNPKEKEWQTTYGVIADMLVGKHILGEEAGIYTPENSIVMDENGLSITTNSEGKKVFAIQRENAGSVEDLMYINDNGDLVLNGTIRINENGQEDDYQSSVKKQIDLSLYKRTKDANGNIVTEFSDDIKGLLDKAQTENELRLDDYYDKAYFDGFLSFDPDTGLSIGQSGSEFRTVITDTAMEFKDDSTTTAYISNEQLYINSAIIKEVFSIGNYGFVPHKGTGKKGFSIVWNGG